MKIEDLFDNDYLKLAQIGEGSIKRMMYVILTSPFITTRMVS